MEVALEDTLVRKNSMSLRKKNIDSTLQETKIDMNTCKPGTGTAGPEIVESECEESSSGSTVTIESPLTAKLEPSVYYDKVQGVWKCHHCSWFCPVLKPGVELIDNHKERCQRVKNTQELVRRGFTLEHEIQECSRANLCLANGGGEIENENTDLIKDKTMPIPLERKTRMPEESISTGNVEEEIVRVLTEQQSHDILCPVCGSCITERVILRKRKRTSQGFVDKRPKGNVSSEVDSMQGSGYQNDQQQAPTEVKEEIYGCLSCLSFFIRRVEECFGTGNRDINTLTTNMPLPAGTNKQDILTAVIKGDKIENELGKHDGLPDNYKNGSSEDSNESNKGSHLCNCIPVSIQSILSAWSSKQILKDGQLREPLLGKKPLSEGPTPADGQLREPLLGKKPLDEGPPSADGQLREPLLGKKPLDEGPPPADGQLREPVLGKKPLDEGPPPADGQLREPLLGKKPLDEGPPPADGQLREPLLGKKPLDEGPPPADGHSTITNVHPNVEPGGVPTEPITDHVVQWDILKSTVYGGLNVSLTSFGVVSSAAGGEAKTYGQLREPLLGKKPLDEGPPPADGQLREPLLRKKPLDEGPPPADGQLREPLLGKKPLDEGPPLADGQLREPLLGKKPLDEGPPLTDGQLREPLLGKKPLDEGPPPADGQLREPLLGKKTLDKGPPPADGQLREPLLGKKPLDEGPPPADGQLREPMLGKKPLDEGPPPADGQLREPLLGKKPLDEGPPPADGQLREPLLGKKPLDEGPPPADGQLREPLLGKKPLDEGPPPADGHLREPLLGKKPLDEGPPLADGHSTIINVHPNVERGGVPTEPITDHVMQWDILKSIVYGGLNVSLTSFGVVSTAAGGEAKTLTVIAIGLANMVTGLFMLCNSIMDPQNREAIGHNWFNGYVALVSYLFFGCLAPITYGFSFQKSDDRNYKFLTTSAVALVSIVLLALGKAHVNRPNTLRHYFATVSLYVVGGLWVSIIGYVSGDYISKLLHKWGFKTDDRNTDGPLYY